MIDSGFSRTQPFLSRWPLSPLWRRVHLKKQTQFPRLIAGNAGIAEVFWFIWKSSCLCDFVAKNHSKMFKNYQNLTKIHKKSQKIMHKWKETASICGFSEKNKANYRRPEWTYFIYWKGVMRTLTGGGREKTKPIKPNLRDPSDLGGKWKNKAKFEIAAVAALLRNDILVNFEFSLEQKESLRRYIGDNRLFWYQMVVVARASCPCYFPPARRKAETASLHPESRNYAWRQVAPMEIQTRR